MRRLASFVDVYSSRPGGTAIVAHVAAPEASAPAARRWEVGAVCVPKSGEEVCGDGWAAADTADGYRLMMADGLGHGLGAAEAARAAVRCFERDPTLGPAAQVSAIHQALRGTRGAAVAVVNIDRRAGVAIFAGVGNIAGSIIANRGSRQLVSSTAPPVTPCTRSLSSAIPGPMTRSSSCTPTGSSAAGISTATPGSCSGTRRSWPVSSSATSTGAATT